MTDLSPALLRFGDVSVRLSVELGRTDMPLRDVLSLGQGSVVALNRLTDELLDITANGKVVAQGEVIAQGGKFALRIVNLVGEEPGAPAPVSPSAMGTGYPEAARAAATPTEAKASFAASEPQPAPPSPTRNEAPRPEAPVSAEPPASNEVEKQEVEKTVSSPQPPADAPVEAASPSGAEPEGLDDLLDSTLDELTDALDDITPEEGRDDGEVG